MADGAHIVIHVGYSDATTGLWCPHCLKPSGYSYDVYWLKESGVSPLVHIRRCYDCGAPLPEETTP